MNLQLDSLKVVELANDLQQSLYEYREATYKDPLFSKKTAELFETDVNPPIERINRSSFKSYELVINAAEYWAEIVFSKIRLIEMIGGQSLMDAFYRRLTDIYQPVYKQFISEM